MAPHAVRADGGDEFDLVVEVSGVGRVSDLRAVRDKACSILREDDGRGALRVAAHLRHMIRIVLAHTEDAPDGKARIRALDGPAHGSVWPEYGFRGCRAHGARLARREEDAR